MSKFRHMNDKEIVSHIDAFGTNDERELLERFQSDPDWSKCPECVCLATELKTAERQISKALKALS